VTGISGLTNTPPPIWCGWWPACPMPPSPASTVPSRCWTCATWSVNGGAIAARGDDGIHVAAYLGDTSGNAVYTSYDAQHVQRVLGRLDTGFGAYPDWPIRRSWAMPMATGSSAPSTCA
jgi:hypothetical protein